MIGCYGNSQEDRHFSNLLDRYLDGEYICERCEREEDECICEEEDEEEEEE